MKRLLWVLIVGLVLVLSLSIGLVAGCSQTPKPEAEKSVDNQVNELLQKSEDELLAEVAKLPDEQINLGLVALVLAKGYYPDVDINKYLKQLDEMAEELKQLIGDEKEPEKIIQIINHYLYETKKIKKQSRTLEEAFKREDIEAFLNKVLDTMMGNCTGLSTLYLALAERLGLPIYGVEIPGHQFVRYDDGNFRRNIEMTDNGKQYAEEYYIKFAEEKLKVGKLLKEDIDYFGLLKNQSKKDFLEQILRIRARCNHMKGAKQEAKTDWQKAIKLSSKPAATYNHIAMQLSEFLDEKDYDEAISWSNKAIELSPGFYLFYQYRGRIYYNKNELDNALQDYNKAIEMNANSPFSYHGRGIVYYKKKEYDKALKDFDKAIKLLPDGFNHHHGRATILYKKKEYNKSLKSIKEVMGHRGDRPQVLETRVYLGFQGIISQIS